MSRTERRRDALILDEDPDLGEDLDHEQFAHAREHLVATAASYPSGGWPVGPDAFDGRTTLGLLVIDGLLVRGVTVGDHTCAELLGPGDILQPWLRLGPEQSVPTEVDWDVVDPVSIAILDRDFVQATADWPEVSVAISRRIMQRAHWLAFHLAVCGLRRVEERLLVVLWHFADRWGTVTPDGVRLD